MPIRRRRAGERPADSMFALTMVTVVVLMALAFLVVHHGQAAERSGATRLPVCPGSPRGLTCPALMTHGRGSAGHELVVPVGDHDRHLAPGWREVRCRTTGEVRAPPEDEPSRAGRARYAPERGGLGERAGCALDP